jgi:hypothetical protein
MEPTTGFTTTQPLLFIILIFCVTGGFGILAYLLKLLFHRWDLTKFEVAYNSLKGNILFDVISNDNFSKIELGFTELKCTGMDKNKVTELWNYFISRFDKVNKYKKKVIPFKSSKDIYKIRLESNIETFIKELAEIIQLEEDAVKLGDRGKILLYRDNERITTEKLELLRNILNTK